MGEKECVMEEDEEKEQQEEEEEGRKPRRKRRNRRAMGKVFGSRRKGMLAQGEDRDKGVEKKIVEGRGSQGKNGEYKLGENFGWGRKGGMRRGRDRHRKGIGEGTGGGAASEATRYPDEAPT